MLPLDTLADIEGLAGFHAEAEAVLALPDEELYRPVPEVSGWSPGHHLFHVLLANELAFRNVNVVLKANQDPEGASRWFQPSGEPTLLGYHVQLWEWIPRGVAKSPRAVTPPAKPDPEIVRDTLRSCRESFDLLCQDPQRLIQARGGVPHQDLGWLTAAGWLRFAKLHGWHHLAIVRDVRAAG